MIEYLKIKGDNIMGYESRLYVVDKHKDMKNEDLGLVWASVIAVYDLSKVGEDFVSKVRAFPDTDCYVYADDGNTQIVEDCYGAKLKEIPLNEMIAILAYEIGVNSYYRRFKPILALLMAFDPKDWDNLVVLHYGY